MNCLLQMKDFCKGKKNKSEIFVIIIMIYKAIYKFDPRWVMNICMRNLLSSIVFLEWIDAEYRTIQIKRIFLS